MRFRVVDSVSGEGFKFAPGEIVDMDPSEAQRKLGTAAVPVVEDPVERAVPLGAPEAAVRPPQPAPSSRRSRARR